MRVVVVRAGGDPSLSLSFVFRLSSFVFVFVFVKVNEELGE